jgi:predicted RNase H-like nuclease (RuvC/YqgF family)
VETEPARPTQSTASKIAAIAARVGRSSRRLERLETRIDHLEAELEGLQDAVDRQAMQEAENIRDLRRRIEPARLARDLSDDARRRGL